MSGRKDAVPQRSGPPLSEMKIDIRAARAKGMVYLRFSPEKSWVGFDTRTARSLAQALVKAADESEKRLS